VHSLQARETSKEEQRTTGIHVHFKTVLTWYFISTTFSISFLTEVMKCLSHVVDINKFLVDVRRFYVSLETQNHKLVADRRWDLMF
jgi:hypothetical protein